MSPPRREKASVTGSAAEVKRLAMENPRPRILIADDHVVFAEALRLLLEKNYTVVGCVPDGRALVREAAKLKPDVVVVDVGMPLLNGLDAAERIREQLPEVKLVFLTMQDNPSLAAAALELGSQHAWNSRLPKRYSRLSTRRRLEWIRVSKLHPAVFLLRNTAAI